jgi:glycosyltransferase involved in cell wall biosynthesis
MRKKILIVIPGFKHGGTNRSLLNLMSLIDKNRYEIYIFGMSRDGVYRDLFKDSKILKEIVLISALVSNFNKQKNIFRKFFFGLIKISEKLFSFINIDLRQIIYKAVVEKKQFKRYDTIIAFQEGDATLFASQIKCKNKIAWIHCNYAEHLKYLNIEPETNIYKKFNSIVCVSEYTKKLFLDLIPELSEQLFAIHNTLNIENVLNQSINLNLSSIFNNNVFNIISVGRIDISKRFSVIPEIVNDLKNKGFVFKWFLIGGINHIDEARNLFANIEAYDIKDFFYYLGEVDNPYPYILNSNLLVSTSVTEAFPYVIIEAKALGIPVLVTNFGSAEECVKIGKEGMIAPIEKISDSIELLISDDKFYNSIKINLANFEYNNSLIMNQVYEIL